MFRTNYQKTGSIKEKVGKGGRLGKGCTGQQILDTKINFLDNEKIDQTQQAEELDSRYCLGVR